VSEQVDAEKYIKFKKKASFNPTYVKNAFGVTGMEHPKPAYYKLANLADKTDQKEW